MAQRSISSFFTPKPKSKDSAATDSKSPSVTSKKNVSPEDEDAVGRKENVEANANATSKTERVVPAGADSPQPSAAKREKFDLKKKPEPRPTAKVQRKRKSEQTDSLQSKQSPEKRVKSESSSVADESKARSDGKNDKCDKSMDVDEEDSPVKASRSSRKASRIVSDSEESNDADASADKASIKPEKSPQASPSSKSPAKASPVKADKPNKKGDKTKESKPVAGIFAKSGAGSRKSAGSKGSPSKSSPKQVKAEAVSPSKKADGSAEDVKVEASPTAASKPKVNPFANFFTSSKSGGSAASADNKAAGPEYSKAVRKTVYNPVEDCFWKRGEKTPFLALTSTLVAIEETSGRLKTIEILANYFRSVMVQTPEDLLPSVYLTLNRLAPAWDALELNIGDMVLCKAIANTTGRTLAQVRADLNKAGDLGIVAETSKSSQRTMFQPAILTVQSVFGKLKEIAAMTGTSAMQKKAEKIQSLLVACRGSEARFLMRSLAGKLRIGLAEQSVLQALAHACVQTPLLQGDYPPAVLTAFKSAESDQFKEKLAKEALLLKTAYCECPTYDKLIPALLEVGVENLHSQCRLSPGIPLKPMLAHPTKGVQEVLTRFENCKFTCEWKYDGERAQIHLHSGKSGKINIYSRNQEDNTTKYPDIIARFPNCMNDDVESAVLDCEAVAWDREKKTIQPFQVLSTRKRKDAVESEIKVQVCLFAFDLLYLNGESLVKKPFQERRELLRSHFKTVEGEFEYAKSVDGNTTEEIQEALEESIRDNCEGLMVKTLDIEATYEIARRSRNWLKLKKDYLDGVGDTIDLVVIGGYLGKGKRTGVYGGFLLACYDPDNEEYQTICKIGTGFTDEDLQKHAAFLKEHVIDKPKSYYSFEASLAPDHWFDPVQVWEVRCADLSISPIHKAAMGIVDPSKGVSLRFPRFIRIRDDKNPEDATGAEQIADMYKNQEVVKNQNKGSSKAEDDFDF